MKISKTLNRSIRLRECKDVAIYRKGVNLDELSEYTTVFPIVSRALVEKEMR